MSGMLSTGNSGDMVQPYKKGCENMSQTADIIDHNSTVPQALFLHMADTLRRSTLAQPAPTDHVRATRGTDAQALLHGRGLGFRSARR